MIFRKFLNMTQGYERAQRRRHWLFPQLAPTYFGFCNDPFEHLCHLLRATKAPSLIEDMSSVEADIDTALDGATLYLVIDEAQAPAQLFNKASFLRKCHGRPKSDRDYRPILTEMVRVWHTPTQRPICRHRHLSLHQYNQRLSRQRDIVRVFQQHGRFRHEGTFWSLRSLLSMAEIQRPYQ